MKRLYQLTLNQETEVETQVETKNEAGETVITKKKEKQSVPHVFFLAKPSRSLIDQATLYTSVEVGKALRAGMMSIFQLDKKYREDGVFTEADNQKYKSLYDDLIKLLDELQSILKVEETARTEEQKSRMLEINKNAEACRSKLSEFESIKSNLYSHSAEYRARNLTIAWWTLFLSYKEENGKESPLYPGNSFDDKLKVYDLSREDTDSLAVKATEKLMQATAFWMSNPNATVEDFANLDRVLSEFN